MKDRYRLFELVLYQDTKSYDIDEVLRNIRSEKYYAYCLHNVDRDEKGNFKKAHYHVVIKLDNATTESALAKRFNVPTQFVNHIRNERSYIRYLIHFDDKEKYQYLENDIVCSRSYERYVHKCFNDKETEEQILDNIFCYINDLISKNTCYTSLLMLLIKYVNINCYDTIYKRYRYEIKDYILTIK